MEKKSEKNELQKKSTQTTKNKLNNNSEKTNSKIAKTQVINKSQHPQLEEIETDDEIDLENNYEENPFSSDDVELFENREDAEYEQMSRVKFKK
jgi:hypothetical protein